MMDIFNFTKNENSSHNYGLILYLGYFSNNANIKFIENTNYRIQHFGDINANSFKILKDLQKRIRRNIIACKMGLDEIERYKNYGKSITQTNISKLNKMLLYETYTTEEKEIFKKLLDYKITIEQEIVKYFFKYENR